MRFLAKIGEEWFLELFGVVQFKNCYHIVYFPKR
jgi:hypothetical protein